jgi:hypothetical protein
LTTIQKLFGNQILAMIDMIRCSFSRDDTLHVSIANDDDIAHVFAIVQATGVTRLSFRLMKKRIRTFARLVSLNSHDDSDSIFHDEHRSQSQSSRSDSPPPGTIIRQNVPTNQTIIDIEGGRFIPETVNSSFEFSSIIFKEK